jgi:O-antigen/teichoic acid export membrane protein
MTSSASTTAHKSPASGVLQRFAHLISAQGVDAVGSGLFFLCLARWDSLLYGEIMYALAAGAVVMKVVQFGLYYPLVRELTATSDDKAPRSLATVNAVKILLLAASMVGVWLLSYFKGLPARMTWILYLGCLGFGLEALAETFFAYLRVRGRQNAEARIKIVAAVMGYGTGFLSVLLSLPGVLAGCYKTVAGLVCVGLGIIGSETSRSAWSFAQSDWPSIRRVFLAATVFGLIDIVGMVYGRANVFFLESAAGVEGVAVYSAAWMGIDSISAAGSEQLLAWVIFPILSVLWVKNRAEVAPLVRRTALWLLALAVPTMFLLYAESDLMIWLLYGSQYTDAAWVQRYLVWTIVCSFEHNLFAYLMIVAGAQRTLLAFSLLTLAANIMFNVILVQRYGLAGACVVFLLTKLVMMATSAGYCQLRFALFKLKDFAFLFALGGACALLFVLVEPIITLHPAVALTLAVYLLFLWKPGMRLLGKLPRK